MADHEHRIKAATAVVLAYYRADQSIVAQNFFEREIMKIHAWIIRHASGVYLKDLVAFARMLHLLGDPDAATEEFRFAIERTKQKHDAEWRSTDLAGIAVELAKAGRGEWAVEVLGCVSSQRAKQFPPIAEILLEESDIRSFLLLIEIAAHDPAELYPLLGMLGIRYPERAEEIANLLLGSDWFLIPANEMVPIDGR